MKYFVLLGFLLISTARADLDPEIINPIPVNKKDTSVKSVGIFKSCELAGPTREDYIRWGICETQRSIQSAAIAGVTNPAINPSTNTLESTLELVPNGKCILHDQAFEFEKSQGNFVLRNASQNTLSLDNLLAFQCYGQSSKSTQFYRFSFFVQVPPFCAFPNQMVESFFNNDYNRNPQGLSRFSANLNANCFSQQSHISLVLNRNEKTGTLEKVMGYKKLSRQEAITAMQAAGLTDLITYLNKRPEPERPCYFDCNRSDYHNNGYSSDPIEKRNPSSFENPSLPSSADWKYDGYGDQPLSRKFWRQWKK